MNYEVEPFGIKLIPIEPALLNNTDSYNNAKITAKQPIIIMIIILIHHSQMMYRLFEAYNQIVEEYKISTEEVARVIVNAVV